MLPLMALVTGGGVASAGAASAPRAAHGASVRTTGIAAGNPFCKRLSKRRLYASSGARSFCFGPKTHVDAHARPVQGKAAPGAPSNVDAASFAEDVTPSGVSAGGQSETSIAASGQFVAEAWNDSTGFFSSCSSPMGKEELTGVGFSNDGGKTFHDLGGLPNSRCTKDLYEGDPTVAAYQVGGSTYFYFGSLFDSPTGLGLSRIAMDACKVVGSGSAATLSCSQPVIVGNSSQCVKFQIGRHRFAKFCSFLDKEFMTIDPAHGRLYMTYTDFLIRGNGGTQVDVAACDLDDLVGAGPGGEPRHQAPRPGHRVEDETAVVVGAGLAAELVVLVA